MSLSYERLPVVEVRDPRTIVENQRQYAVLRSGSQVTMKQWTTTSVSQSSIQFSCPPPSGKIFVDRKVYITLPIRLTFTGTSPPGQVLLNPNCDAPRAYPFSSSVDTLQATINNQSVSINMADIIQPLLHYNTDDHLCGSDYSMTPNLLDQSQAYSQLYGTNRSPMAFYGDTLDKTMSARGGFPFTVVSNTATSAVIDMVVCEPIFLSPFYFGKHNDSAFYNVTTMDFNITFLGNAGFRMWSHDAVSGPGTTITGISWQFNNFISPPFTYTYANQPVMNFTYITPNETQVLPYDVPITYPYFDITRYPTDSGNAYAPGDSDVIPSNNIQLNSIPRRIYIWCRERNADLYSTCANPDTYFQINNINIQFENKNGLLASASKRHLYEMCVKNHCKMTWAQWSGESMYHESGPFSSAPSVVGPGTIMCIEFATDIGLDSLEAPGRLGSYMLLVQANVRNVSNRSIVPTLYICVVSEGTFTIQGLGSSSTNIGVISSEDILNARMQPGVNYYDVEDINGGNFWSGLVNFGKDVGKRIWQGLKKWDNRASKTLDYLMDDVAPKVIKHMASGEGVLHRAALRHRMRH